MRTSLHRMGMMTLAASWLFVAGCGDETSTGVGGSGGGGVGGSGGASEGGQGGQGGGQPICSSLPAPPLPSDNWCDRIFLPKGASSTNARVDWSRAHAFVRFFGPVESYAAADTALASAFESKSAWNGQDASLYANGIEGVACSLSPFGNTTPVPKMHVGLINDIAVVQPGEGALILPSFAKAVFLDFRSIEGGEEMRPYIEKAVRGSVKTTVPGLIAKVRKHTGMVDEVISATNVFLNEIEEVPSADIVGEAKADLPLAVLTRPRMNNAATEIAAALRLTNRAFLIGEDLRMEGAEQTWFQINQVGLSVRYKDLHLPKGERTPDVIPADVRTSTPECFANEILTIGAPPPLTLGEGNRPQMKKTSPFGDEHPAGDPKADLRAALTIAHGAARTFYPYFDTVGDTIDQRLIETGGEADGITSRDEARDILRRFGEALTDGHNFVFDYELKTQGYLPIFIEDIGDAAVVRRSAIPEISPGDTIVAMDGEDASTWYERELGRSGGATPGYKRDIATRELLTMSADVTLDLESALGEFKQVTISPQPLSLFNTVSVASSRQAGPLSDLNAPEYYYINLDGSIVDMISTFNAALAAGMAAQGLVVDMRGYPGVNHYTVAQRLVQQMFSSPIFRVPTLLPLSPVVKNESFIPLNPLSTPSFSGPIVLLVGHHTVSAAENFGTMLVDANRVTVIGRQSAGTNGNITGIQLPGHFAFTFTGMEVRHADAEKSVFHGTGLVPSVEVPLSAADFAAGNDPELMAAIQWLQNN